jgi:hypothetical protein
MPSSTSRVSLTSPPLPLDCAVPGDTSPRAAAIASLSCSDWRLHLSKIGTRPPLDHTMIFVARERHLLAWFAGLLVFAHARLLQIVLQTRPGGDGFFQPRVALNCGLARMCLSGGRGGHRHGQRLDGDGTGGTGAARGPRAIRSRGRGAQLHASTGVGGGQVVAVGRNRWAGRRRGASRSTA